jgi:hypothetical protein
VCPRIENVECAENKEMAVGPVLTLCFHVYLIGSYAMLRILGNIKIIVLCDMTSYSLDMGPKLYGVIFQKNIISFEKCLSYKCES